MRDFVTTIFVYYYSLLFVSMILFILHNNYFQRSNKIIFPNYLILIWIPISAVFIGGRSVEVGTDTISYALMYERATNNYSYEYFEVEIFFYFYLKLLSTFNSFSFFLYTTYLVFILCLTYFLKKISQFYGVILILYFSTFFFYSLSINIIRNGLSFPFWLLGFYYFTRKENFKMLTCFLVSILLHKSAFFVFIMVPLVRKLSIKTLIFTWAIVSSLSLVNLDPIKSLISSIGLLDDIFLYSKYINNSDSEYLTGFRFTFWLINASVIAYALLAKVKNSNFVNWFKLFILLSILAVFSFQYPYSDRMNLFSWFLIPVLITLIEEQRGSFNKFNYPLRVVLISFIISIPSFYLMYSTYE